MPLDDPTLQRLRRAMAGSRDGYWERDLRRNTSWYSPSFRAMLGFAEGELPDDRRVVNSRIHPEDRPEFLRRYEQALAQHNRFDYEVRYLDAQQRWRWLRGRGQVWLGGDGQPEFITGAISDVQAEKAALQSLATLGRRFERAIEAAAEGLFERFAGDNEIYLSDRFLELIGLPRGGLPGGVAALNALIHPEDLPAHRAAVDAAVAQLQRWELKLRVRHASGDYRWFHQRGIAERQPDGRVKLTGMAADVHEQTLQRQELERTREHLEALVQERTARLEAALALAEERRIEAERANAAKSRFLAHMSHEIRTPLNGVLGLIELARRLASVPDQQRYLDVARQSGQLLLQVISDVLDFSRIEAGRVELRPRPFDLAQSLADTLRGVMPLVRERDLLMLYDWRDGPGWVEGDEGALRQIVTNLLGNAVKFTEQGHISLVGGTQRLPDGRLAVEIVVEDSGPGIAPERRPQVFDAFVQGDDSLSRGYGGTGLGLAIARALAQAMGGHIELDCPPAGGSRFTLRLPLAAAAAPAADRPASAREAAAPAPPGLAWLLYMQPLGAAWLQRRLQRLDWHTACFADIDQALARHDGGAPQLVVLAESPRLDAQVLRRLREALPAVPIRLLIRPQWHEPALEALAREQRIAALVAPMTPSDLARMAAPAAAAADDTTPVAPRWRAGAEVLLVEDNPVNQMIGEEFLRTLGLPVRVVGDGLQALAACVEQPPSLVLMDLQMPGLDGLQTAQRLRALQRQGRWPGAPIVALTAHAGADDHAACLAAGMDGVLTKPLQLQTLRQALARWLAA